MYEFSCGSVPCRGVHYGKRFIKQWVMQDRKNTKYYLKMDVRKFYPSVKPDRVMEKLRRVFKDYRLLNLIGLILSKADGLPIGMLLSQVFANFFMTDVDHYIKQELKAVHYVRYMDDMVVFGRNKKELHKMRVAIAAKLAESCESRARFARSTEKAMKQTMVMLARSSHTWDGLSIPIRTICLRLG